MGTLHVDTSHVHTHKHEKQLLLTKMSQDLSHFPVGAVTYARLAASPFPSLEPNTLFLPRSML